MALDSAGYTNLVGLKGGYNVSGVARLPGSQGPHLMLWAHPSLLAGPPAAGRPGCCWQARLLLAGPPAAGRPACCCGPTLRCCGGAGCVLQAWFATWDNKLGRRRYGEYAGECGLATASSLWHALSPQAILHAAFPAIGNSHFDLPPWTTRGTTLSAPAPTTPPTLLTPPPPPLCAWRHPAEDYMGEGSDSCGIHASGAGFDKVDAIERYVPPSY